jgi:hypothetical protein
MLFGLVFGEGVVSARLGGWLAASVVQSSSLACFLSSDPGKQD